MVRRDRNKINNLRDDLKKFKDNLWELENSDGFQFCSKYAEKCSKGNKFGFEICFVGNIFVTNTLWYNSERPPRSPRLGRRTTGTGTTARDFRNGNRPILREPFKILPRCNTALPEENRIFFVKPRKVRWNA